MPKEKEPIEIEIQKRAIRRRHSRRMKRRAKKIFPDWPFAAKCADHLRNCSCWKCTEIKKSPKKEWLWQLLKKEIEFYQRSA